VATMEQSKVTNFVKQMDEELLREIFVLSKLMDVEGKKPEEKTDLSPITNKREFIFPEGYVKFSEIFWPPETIPDVPVPKLKWTKESTLYIPSSEMRELNSFSFDHIEQMAMAMYTGDTILLWGPTGSGKTEVTKAMCDALQIPWYRINCDREQTKSDLIGSPILEYDENGKQYIKIDSTPITDCIRNGGMLVLDESFRSPSLMVLQSLLEKSSRTLIIPDAPGLTPDERILRPPANKFWIVLTDNTQGVGSDSGSYISEVQDLSTLNRINTTIYVDYPEPRVEKKMLTKKFPEVKTTVINDIIKFAGQVRKSFVLGTMFSTFSLRDSQNVCEKLIYNGNIKDSFCSSWYNKLANEDKSKAQDMFHQIFSIFLDEG
jgi:MoxR-like ATPase